jgi:hypothetical protein
MPINRPSTVATARPASATSDFNDLTQTLAQTPASASVCDGDLSAGADANGHGADASDSASVCTNPLKNKAAEAADAADANSYTLADERIRELAGDYLDAAAMELEETGDGDRAALERRLRENLATAGVPPESVEAELGRIMEVLLAV